MGTVTATRRTIVDPAGDATLPLRRLSVDEYHAMRDLGLLPEGGVELLDGLIVERRYVPRQSDPWVDRRQVPVMRLTLEDYHRLRDAGTLDAGKPCEFLDGLLVETMIRRPPHDTALGLLQDRLEPLLPTDVILRNQSALTLTDGEPEPDLAVVRGSRRDFADQHPGPEATLLVVEIADTSLSLDRTHKLEAYARHSIPQYWIVNLIDDQVEVYSDPTGLVAEPEYRRMEIYEDGQSVPLVLDGRPIANIAVSDILP
jgi:Uma2 family endonuclease